MTRNFTDTRPLCTRCEITLAMPPSPFCSACLADEVADRDADHFNDALDGEEDELEDDCGLGRDGQCSMAGTEHCDFECPNRDSELFCGSTAWNKKHST